jgi:hypothetical protein
MAAGATYEPIATANGTGSSGIITFNSIPQTYTDLYLAGTFSGTSAGAFQIVVNNDTASNYSFTHVRGNGSSALSNRNSNQANWTFNYENSYGTGGTYNAFLANFNNYTNTTTYKNILARYNSVTVETMAYIGLYRQTTAITRLDIKVSVGSFETGSTLTLYGIAAA